MTVHELEEALATLQRRVQALEEENARLRQRGLPPAPDGVAAERGASRRQLLAGGVGMVGALATGALVGRGEGIAAAAENVTGRAGEARATSRSLSVTVPPQRTGRAVWADHEWALGADFGGETPPVVLASAYDDTMEHDVTQACACAAVVRGTPGAYRAHIMVRNVSRSARAVVIYALALNE